MEQFEPDALVLMNCEGIAQFKHVQFCDQKQQSRLPPAAMTVPLKFKLYPTVEELVIPERKSEGAAGYDVYSPQAFEIQPRTSVRVSLGFRIDLPDGVLINLYMRSGLALKKGLNVVGRRIYGSKEEVFVEIRNYSEETYRASRGDRIVQMVFHEALMLK